MTKRLSLPLLLILCILISGCEPTIEQANIISEIPEEIIELIKEDPSLVSKYADGEIELPAGVSIDMLDALAKENVPVEEAIVPSNVFDGILQGSGTTKDPYLIYTVEDLMVLQQYSYATLASHYMLMDDIYLPVVEYGESNWAPIGGYDEYFMGTFDGNGKVIHNLTIYVDDSSENLYSINVGLFSTLYGSDAVVKNLGIENSSIYVKNNMIANVNAGFITSYIIQGSIIENCYAEGSITIENYKSASVGGLVGNSSISHISNCHSDVDILIQYIEPANEEVRVTSNSGISKYAGGIVGQASGMIQNCYTRVNITISSINSSYAGGIVAYGRGTISSCYSVGKITGALSSGGIVAETSKMNFTVPTIENCFTIIDILSPKDDVNAETTRNFSGGGIVNTNSGLVTNCYAMGKIEVASNAAGIANTTTSGNIENCIALQSVISGNTQASRISGNISGTSSTTNNWGWTGIDVMRNGARISNDYSHVNLPGGADILINDLSSKDFYESLKWDFSSDNPIWTFNEILNLPVLVGLNLEYLTDFDLSYFSQANERNLLSTTILKGTGTKEDPYLIYTANDLNMISILPSSFMNGHYKLMNDIALAIPFDGSSNWTPIGTNSIRFNGTFDGNGKKISGMVIEGDSSAVALGLFGYLGNTAMVSNLDLTNIRISYDPNSEVRAGGIAAFNYGIIENCSVSGEMGPSSLIDVDFASIETEDDIDKYWDMYSIVGGMVGYNVGTITKSHSDVSLFIEASGEFGGIAAINYGTIERTFSATRIYHLHIEDEFIVFLTYVGGIAGSNYNIVSDCYSTGYIISQGFVGGIVGDNFYDDSMVTSITTDAVAVVRIVPTTDGQPPVMLIEYLNDNSPSSSSTMTRISNCYSTCEVLIGYYVTGGIAALNSGLIESCVALPQGIGGSAYVGLTVGGTDDYSNLINNYTSNGYFIDGYLPDNDPSLKKTTLSRLLQRSFYQSLGWDFTEIWDTKSGYGFPILKGVKGQENLVTPDTFR